MILTSSVLADETTKAVARAFDYPFDGSTTTEVKELPTLPSGYAIGLIVGALTWSHEYVGWEA